MKSKKPLLIGSIFAGIALAGLIGYAASAQGASTGPTLVDKIAQHFNLNKAEVQKVFDDNRAQKMADRETKYEARLTQAVTDGKLTVAQKDLILAKHKEVIAFMATLKDKSPADRRSALTQERTDIQAWEKQNNIPTGYLSLMGPGLGGRHAGIRNSSEPAI